VGLASLLLPATELALLMRYTGIASLGECNTAAQGEQRQACQRGLTSSSTVFTGVFEQACM
jgi:hypothetical protein